MTVVDKQTCTLSQGNQEQITQNVTAIVDRRAPIEQAKGMLMFVYGVDAEAAFDMLRTHSQEHNVKLGLIAEQVVKDLVELSREGQSSQGVKVDGLLSTAHHRIATSAARQLDGESKTGMPMRNLGT
jgi:cysteine synthase